MLTWMRSATIEVLSDKLFRAGVVKLALSEPQGVSEALQGVYDR